MKLYIKNMVCIRCETVVKSELEKLGLPYQSVKSGEVIISDDLNSEERVQLNIALEKSGLGLLEDKKSVLVEKIKNSIIDLVHNSDERLKVNLSDYLKKTLEYDYAYLARLFAEVIGITIEQYFIALRIERAKELLIYGDLSLSEIADKLFFSGTSHFCTQFKKITGLKPSFFRQIKRERLIPEP